MQNYCGKMHKPDYNSACCFKFLIEMHDHAESQTLIHKYAKLFLTTINHYYKMNKLSFEYIKLDMMKLLLEILTKVISHFFFLNKFDFSKVLVKIALKACNENPYREHPDIIQRSNAILNNLACIYEKNGIFAKALKCLKSSLKFSMSNIDAAITYNNICRLYLCMKDKSNAYQTSKLFYESFREEVEKVLKERIYKTDTSCSGKIQLLSFLYYNYGLLLEKLNKDKESMIMYRKGYEFSLSTLGEYSILTNKFVPKLNMIKKLLQSNTFLSTQDIRKPTIDSRYDSDNEYISNDNTTPKYGRKFSPSDRKVTMNPTKKIRRDFSYDNIMNHSQQLIRTETDVSELKQKMDLLLKKVEHMGDFEKTLTKVMTRSKSKGKLYENDDGNDTLNNTFYQLDSDKNSASRKVLFSVDNFKKINQISFDESTPMSNKDKGSAANHYNIMTKKLTKDESYLNELVAEFQHEESKSKNFIKNISGVKLPKLNDSVNMQQLNGPKKLINNNISSSKPRRSIKDMFQKVINLEDDKKKTSSGLSFSRNINDPSPLNTSQNNTEYNNINGKEKQRRSIKDMFSKVVGNPQPTKVDNNKKDVSKSTLAKLLSSLDEHEPPVVKNNGGYNDIMNNFDKSKSNVMNINKKISFNNESLIDLEDNKPKPMPKSLYDITPVDLKPDLKKETTKFNFNIMLDSEDDKYECTTYFHNTNNSNKFGNNENESGLKQVIKDQLSKYSVHVQIDKEDDRYEFIPLYFKNESFSAQTSKPKPLKFVSLVQKIKKCYSTTYIVEELDYNKYENEENVYINQKSEEVNIKKYFENIIKLYKESNKIYSIIRELDEEFYKIAISFGKNSTKQDVIYVRVYKEKSEQFILENVIPFDKLKSLSAKISVFNSIPSKEGISYVNSMEAFIEKIFIYHCYVTKKDNKPVLGVLARPLGICANKSYEFNFLKTGCVIDLIVLPTNDIKFFIYVNGSETNACLKFDWVMDESSFNSIFSNIENKTFTPLKNENKICNFRIDEKSLSKNGIISTIILRVQEILKHKLQDPNIKLESTLLKLNNSNMKIHFSDSMNTIEYWVISYSLMKWRVDYYSLNKVNIKNESVYLQKGIDIKPTDFERIFGVELKDVEKLLFDIDKNRINHILLNSVKLNTPLINNMYTTEIEKIQIVIIDPISLFNNKFVIVPKTKTYNVVCFELLFYTKNNYFFKLIQYDSFTTKTYTKIITDTNHKLDKFLDDKSTAKALLNSVVHKYPQLLNKTFSEFLRIGLEQYCGRSFTKDVNFNLFDSVTNFLGNF